MSKRPMSDILDEIKEDLDREKFFSLVKKYGKYVVILSVAILIVTAAFLYIEHRRDLKQEQFSNLYQQFLTNIAAGIPKDLLENKDNIYSSLAHIDYALYINQQKHHKESVKYLSSVSEHAKHIEMRNLAGIHALFIMIQHGLLNENDAFISYLKSHTKADQPLGGALIWCLAEAELSKKQTIKSEELLQRISNSSSTNESVKLLYDIAKNSIMAQNYAKNK